MTKKYIKPKIKSVELKPEQSILQVCFLGGVYLSTSSPRDNCIEADPGTPTYTCNIPVRGRSLGIFFNVQSFAQPS